MRTLITLLLLIASAGLVRAQNSLLFAMDGNELTLDNGAGLAEAGLLRPDEIAVVTPRPGPPYSARTFLSVGAQWTFIGDLDLDGRLVDASTDAPGGDVDAVFVKTLGGPAGFSAREVFLSKEDTSGFATGFEDGDVFRYAGQGVLEVFVSEARLLDALGQGATGDVDLDAICQTPGGDLLVSFDLTESVAGVSADDGAIVLIPASAITYDGSGNVASVASGSARVFASEADVNALIAASGVLTSVGGTPTTSIDLTGLEIDPAGGVWTSPQDPNLSAPNVLFAWSGFSNDGAVLSTAGGGTIAQINAVPMGSTTATTGLQIGMLPDSTGLGGIVGLGVIPMAGGRQPVLELYPTRLITTSTILWTRQELSGIVPGAPVIFVIDVGPSAVGSVLPVTATPFGELFGGGTPITLGIAVAGPRGYASMTTILPASALGISLNVVWQAFDLGAMTFTTPAGLQFL